MPKYIVNITPEKLKGRGFLHCNLAGTKRSVTFRLGEKHELELSEETADGLIADGYEVKAVKAAKKETST